MRIFFSINDYTAESGQLAKLLAYNSNQIGLVPCNLRSNNKAVKTAASTLGIGQPGATTYSLAIPSPVRGFVS